LNQAAAYPQEVLAKRRVALRGLIDFARDLDSKREDEINSLNPTSSRAILYPFLEQLLANEEEIQKIMVPHEK
jgi:hypothetical protein